MSLCRGCLVWPCLCQLGGFSHCGVFPPFTYNIGGISQWDISIHTHTLLAGSYFLSGCIEGPSDTDTSTHIHDPRTDSKMIAIIGTSDQPCWLAEACKNHSLEGLWMYGVTVYLDRSYGSCIDTCALERRAPTFDNLKVSKAVGHQVQMWLPWSPLRYR